MVIVGGMRWELVFITLYTVADSAAGTTPLGPSKAKYILSLRGIAGGMEVAMKTPKGLAINIDPSAQSNPKIQYLSRITKLILAPRNIKISILNIVDSSSQNLTMLLI